MVGQQEKGQAHDLLDDLQLQIHSAAAHCLDRIQICRVDRIEHVGDAENPQIRYTRQPLLGQHQPDERFCAEEHRHHQRRDHINAGLDGTAGHVFHPRRLVLHGRHCREQNAVNGRIHVDRDRIRCKHTLIIKGKISRCVNAADHKAAQIIVYGIQQGGSQQSPAIG